MITLIGYELKKIFKNKVNLLLCLIFCILCIYIVHSFFYQDLFISNNLTYQGERVSEQEYLRYLDDFAHEHRGEINDEFIEAMREEYWQMKSDLEDVTDEEMMKRVYGENYQEYLDKNMSEQEFNRWKTECEERYSEAGMAYDHMLYMYRDENGNIEIEKFSKYESYLAELNALFEVSVFDGTFQYEMLNHKEEHLINKEIVHQTKDNTPIKSNSFLSEYWLKRNDSQVSDKMIDEMNQKYLSMPTTYDSTVGARLLCRSFSGTTFVIIMIILLNAILFSDVFSKEAKEKIEPILVTSRLGYKQVTVAKLIIVIFFNLLITAFYLTIIYVVVSSIVPIRSLNITCYYTDVVGVSTVDYLYTYRELLINYVLRIFVSMLATGLMVTFLSCITKKRFVSAMVLLLMLIASVFIYVDQFQWIMFFPYTVATHPGYIDWLSFTNNGFVLFDKDWGWLIGVCLFWGIACLIMFLSCYLKQRRHIVR